MCYSQVNSRDCGGGDTAYSGVLTGGVVGSQLRLKCLHVNLADSQCNGQHLAGSPSHEIPVYSDVLLQELPQYCQDEQLH